jgi:protein SCO1/2
MNKLIIRVGAVLVIFTGAFYWAYKFMQPEVKALPFYDPADVNPELVDPEISNIGRGHTVNDFRFKNQYGHWVTNADVDGRVYVADFFFTTCPSICKDMAKTKRWLQDTLRDVSEFVILSHTVMPEVDSVATLKAYAELHGVQEGKWHLLTGTKDSLYGMARRSYLVAREPPADSDPNHDFIHTENFVLVDQRGRIRGFYDGTSMEEVRKLAEDAFWLIDQGL